MMTPLARYQQDLLLGGILPDDGQAQAIAQLQHVYQALLMDQQGSLWTRIKKKFFSKKKSPVKGLYLWGSVGAGKTYLMDIFFSNLPMAEKKREHFHHFMRYVHEALRRHQGKTDPLVYVAKELSCYKVLCFDEFFVNDIGDAMLLGHLLKALFSQGVTLVATSNIHPDDLYKNGLQRDLFLPAIQQLHQHTTIFHILVSKDYRLRQLSSAGVYFYPLNELNQSNMHQLFSKMAAGPVLHDPIDVAGRLIPVVARTTNVIWFRFDDLCHIPRSQQDYVLLSEQFHTVMLSEVPVIHATHDNAVTYLIYLVDVLYDARVKLIMSAEVLPAEIYLKGRKHGEFLRTLSRLQEMQTKEYLALPHRVLG